MVISMEIRRGGTPIFADDVSLYQMRRKPEDLAEWLFRALDFPVGVFLLSGTAIVPGSTLRAGDEVAVRISGLGSLTNTVELVGAGVARSVA